MTDPAVLDVIVRRAGGRCEARIECLGAPDVLTHHRKRAGRVDSVANCVRLCLTCHTHLHNDPKKYDAYGVGLLLHSTADPSQVPMFGVYLDPDTRPMLPVIRLTGKGIAARDLAALFNARYVGEVA